MMGGGWRVWAANWGMCQTRQPKRAARFAEGNYAVGKAAVDLPGALVAVRRRSQGSPADGPCTYSIAIICSLAKQLFPLDQFSNLRRSKVARGNLKTNETQTPPKIHGLVSIIQHKQDFVLFLDARFIDFLF